MFRYFVAHHHTVSVNVLKENVINFVPPLPKRKLDVLKKIEMTNLVKVMIYLLFHLIFEIRDTLSSESLSGRNNILTCGMYAVLDLFWCPKFG